MCYISKIHKWRAKGEIKVVHNTIAGQYMEYLFVEKGLRYFVRLILSGGLWVYLDAPHIKPTFFVALKHI